MIKKEQIEKIRNIAKGISILYVEDDLVIAHETQKLLKKFLAKLTMPITDKLLMNFIKRKDMIS